MLFKEFWQQYKKPHEVPLEDWSDDGTLSLDDPSESVELYQSLRLNQNWDVLALVLEKSPLIGSLKDKPCYAIYQSLINHDLAALELAINALDFELLKLHSTEIICVSYYMRGLKTLRILMNFRADSSWLAADNNEAFCYAAYAGHSAMLKCLFENSHVRKQAAASNNDAFRRAAYAGHLEIVAFLMAEPSVLAQIASNDNEALLYAVEQEHTAIVNQLLESASVRALLNDYSSQPKLINEGLQRALCVSLEGQARFAHLKSTPEFVCFAVDYLESKFAPRFNRADLKELAQDSYSKLHAQNESLNSIHRNAAAPIISLFDSQRSSTCRTSGIVETPRAAKSRDSL